MHHFHFVWQDGACLLAIWITLVTHWRETHPAPPRPLPPPDYLSSFTYYT